MGKFGLLYVSYQLYYVARKTLLDSLSVMDHDEFLFVVLHGFWFGQWKNENGFDLTRFLFVGVYFRLPLTKLCLYRYPHLKREKGFKDYYHYMNPVTCLIYSWSGKMFTSQVFLNHFGKVIAFHFVAER